MTILRNHRFINRLIALSRATRNVLTNKQWKGVIFTNSRRLTRRLLASCLTIMAVFCLLTSYQPYAHAEEQPSEYRLKVAFLYNFAAYTTWPNPPDRDLALCIHGEDPFGANLQHLQGKKINEHDILIKHTRNIMDLSDCHIVFITLSAINAVDGIIKHLEGMPILTIADSPGAGRQGVVLNMAIKEGKVIFEANIAMAKRNGLNLSSQLLRFASEVYR